jgi:hypothetical protein
MGHPSLVRKLHRGDGMKLPLACVLAALPFAACTPDTNDVLVQLAPEVISSLDGSLGVHAVAIADRQPGVKQHVEVSVTYTDRNGTAHMVAPVDGITDEKGGFDTTFTGLTWDGSGTVKVAVLSGAAGSAPVMVGGMPLEAEATFAVLDRTPPKVVITPPASNQIRINSDNQISVHLTDEIGVSQCLFQTDNTNNNGNGNNIGIRGRSTIIASGATDTTVMFDVTAQNANVGQTVTFYALATDLSGNQAAATPITVTVVQ